MKLIYWSQFGASRPVINPSQTRSVAKGFGEKHGKYIKYNKLTPLPHPPPSRHVFVLSICKFMIISAI